jgi:predicted peroxiredoxin
MRPLAVAVAILTIMTATTSAEPVQAAKPKILVHLTSGPENPTKAALAFLVARTAIEQGHSVSMFLAGDAVQLLRDAALDNLSGLGTGKLREHFDVIVKGGGKFYLSGMSSSARGITAAELQGKPAELAPPAILLKLALENDRMFTY